MKVWTVCLGLKPRAAGWKAHTNPLSYGGTPTSIDIVPYYLNINHLTKVKQMNIYLHVKGRSKGRTISENRISAQN